MKKLHTPGPWAIERIIPGDKDISIPAPSVMVDYDDFDEEGRKEQLANAMLIAAAPELLEALARLVGCISETRGPDAREALEMSLAAINKATTPTPHEHGE